MPVRHTKAKNNQLTQTGQPDVATRGAAVTADTAAYKLTHSKPSDSTTRDLAATGFVAIRAENVATAAGALSDHAESPGASVTSSHSTVQLYPSSSTEDLAQDNEQTEALFQEGVKMHFVSNAPRTHELREGDLFATNMRDLPGAKSWRRAIRQAFWSFLVRSWHALKHPGQSLRVALCWLQKLVLSLPAIKDFVIGFVTHPAKTSQDVIRFWKMQYVLTTKQVTEFMAKAAAKLTYLIAGMDEIHYQGVRERAPIDSQGMAPPFAIRHSTIRNGCTRGKLYRHGLNGNAMFVKKDAFGLADHGRLFFAYAGALFDWASVQAEHPNDYRKRTAPPSAVSKFIRQVLAKLLPKNNSPASTATEAKSKPKARPIRERSGVHGIIDQLLMAMSYKFLSFNNRPELRQAYYDRFKPASGHAADLGCISRKMYLETYAGIDVHWVVTVMLHMLKTRTYQGVFNEEDNLAFLAALFGEPEVSTSFDDKLEYFSAKSAVFYQKHLEFYGNACAQHMRPKRVEELHHFDPRSPRTKAVERWVGVSNNEDVADRSSRHPTLEELEINPRTVHDVEYFARPLEEDPQYAIYKHYRSHPLLDELDASEGLLITHPIKFGLQTNVGLFALQMGLDAMAVSGSVLIETLVTGVPFVMLACSIFSYWRAKLDDHASSAVRYFAVGVNVLLVGMAMQMGQYFSSEFLQSTSTARVGPSML